MKIFLIIFCVFCVGCSINPGDENKKPVIVILESHENAAIEKGDKGTEDNMYGFEGGTVKKVDGIYHLFTAECFAPPKIVKTRLAHWKSSDGIEFERVGTIFESTGVMDGKDPRASLWSPMPVYDENTDRWNLFYVSYKSAPNQPWGNLLNHHGRIIRAKSKFKGTNRIGGPYIDQEIILELDEKRDWWEGLQGVDSFYPYKVGNKWYAFYGSNRYSYKIDSEQKSSRWYGVGLAESASLEGEWRRCKQMGPVLFNNRFVENPVVQKVNGDYLVLFDIGHSSSDSVTLGYAISKDGVNWSKQKEVRFKGPDWLGSMRTPLCMIPEGNNEYLIYYTAFNSKRFEPNETPKYHYGFGTIGRLKARIKHN